MKLLKVFSIILIVLLLTNFCYNKKSTLFKDFKHDRHIVNFKKENSPYIITEDIIVPKFNTLIIEAGTVLLFENNTGLIVNGAIYVRGKKDSLVIFTSINDSLYNPKAKIDAKTDDWNGIYISKGIEEAKIYEVKISYSKIGIRSEEEDITVSNALFGKIKGDYIIVNDKVLSENSSKLEKSYQLKEKLQDNNQ